MMSIALKFRTAARGLPKAVSAGLIALALAGPAAAAQEQYLLDGTGSQVRFTTDFGGGTITGQIPVADASLQLDFQDVRKSAVSVTLNIRGAQASFPFAAQAMTGPEVLDARQFPTATFSSTAFRQDGNDVQVDGNLTMRGVTRPVSLHARLSHVASNPEDFDRLKIRLTGAVSRSAFGATGWRDAVGDEVRLDIAAQIAKAK